MQKEERLARCIDGIHLPGLDEASLDDVFDEQDGMDLADDADSVQLSSSDISDDASSGVALGERLGEQQSIVSLGEQSIVSLGEEAADILGVSRESSVDAAYQNVTWPESDPALVD